MGTPWWRAWFRSTLDLLYPSGCVLCGRFADEENQRSEICADCRPGLIRRTSLGCGICGEYYPGSDYGSLVCEDCRGEKPPFDFAVAPYRFQEQVRELILRFKYSGQEHLRQPLGKMLAEVLDDPRFPPLGHCLAVPVPLHPRRLRERGFNQAEALCEVLTHERGLPWAPLLRRVRYTVPQARFGREERLRNLKGAFELSSRHADKFRDNLLLVDDVYTTGSTARECSEILRRATKAKKIIVITVARG